MRKTGPLKPSDHLRVSIGVDGDDLVTVDPRGNITREKLTDEQ